MIRSAFAALLGAAFGAVAIAPIRARCLEALLPNPELSAVGLTAGVAALLWIPIMACREPPPVDISWLLAATKRPPQPRGAGGRFVKAPPSCP